MNPGEAHSQLVRTLAARVLDNRGHQRRPAHKQDMTNNAIRFFLDRYGLTLANIDSLLAGALARGGDYADLYFEYRLSNSLGLEEEIIKSATKSIHQGVRVRVIGGEKPGYAYTDEITVEAIRKAAETASHIARTVGASSLKGVDVSPGIHNLYPVEVPVSSIELDKKIELVRETDRVARSLDRRIRQVQVSLSDELK